MRSTRISSSCPAGSRCRFRTKGIPGQYEPGPFSRDSVRAILQNPFYAGVVARYPTAPLDMEDDPENPQRRKSKPANPLGSAAGPGASQGGKRQLVELQEGRHPALIPLPGVERLPAVAQDQDAHRLQTGQTPAGLRTDRRGLLLGVLTATASGAPACAARPAARARNTTAAPRCTTSTSHAASRMPRCWPNCCRPPG